MANLHEDLARIREMQGKEPLPSPHVIAGFEAGQPPPPEYLVPRGQQQGPSGVEDEYLDGGPPAEHEPEPTAPPSPLIPRKSREVPSLVLPPGVNLPTLAVLDREGSWKGRFIQLSEADEKQIRAVVLRAIEREVRADLAAAGVQRVRGPKTTPKASSGAPAKRGRPSRGVS